MLKLCLDLQFTKNQFETRIKQLALKMINKYKIPKNKFGAINSNNLNDNIDNERTMIDSMFEPMRQPNKNENLFNNMSMEKNQSQMNDILKQMENERRVDNTNTRPRTPDFLKATKVTSDKPKDLTIPQQNNLHVSAKIIIHIRIIRLLIKIIILWK